MERYKTQFIVKCSFLLTALIASLGGYGYFKLLSWASKPIPLAEEVVMTVPKGVGLRDLAEDLAAHKVISDAPYFRYWVKIQRLFPSFQAGNYHFRDTVSPQDVIAKMTKGDVYHPLALTFTIPEGFTLKQTHERLAALGLGSLPELMAISNDPAFIESCLGMAAPSLEGFLYPATYRYYDAKPQAAAVYRGMVKEFYDRLPPGYSQAIAPFKINLYQAVIIASMIEKETLHEDEMPLVSEVIWRRLREKIPLAIDATLIYGIKDYQGNIQTRHLRDATNLYNTRIHPGLPPTPIGSVSQSALEAVIKPANLGNYFYVLEVGESKKHHFSKTLNEHNRYVRKLVEAHRAKQAN